MRAPDFHRTTHCTCFVDLPPELITAVCGFVESRTVIRCRLVCKRLRDIIDGSLELQYRIELVQDGMTDDRAPCSSQSATVGQAQLTTVDRLTRLRELRHAWETLSWTRCVTVPVAGPCCAYELVGGIFCKTQPGPRPRGTGLGGVGFNPGLLFGLQLGLGVGVGEWNAVGNEEVNRVPSRPVTMAATWLPGRDDERGKTVVREDLGIPTRDFAIDPSQDLMVLLKGDDVGMPAVTGVLELHIRTISSNKAHPGARKPMLCTLVAYPIASVFVQIVDDVVGVMYCVDPSRPRVTIWNWKTGNLAVDCGNGHLPTGTWDFSFINNRTLMVTTTGHSGGSLELFTFSCDDYNADVESEGSSTSTLVHVATLYFPPVLPSVRLLSIGTHTGPFLAGCPPDKLFAASNEDRIHVLTIQYVHLPAADVPRSRPRVCVIVHNRALEGLVKAGVKQGAGVGTTPIQVPWTEWGQKGARMLTYVGIFQWLRYVHGQRVVLLLPTSEAGKSTLQVLDFNVHTNARSGVNHPELGTDVDLAQHKMTRGIVSHPSRIIMPNVFVDAVESRLPYREVCRDIEGDYSGMMIDDERLVGLKYPALLTGDMKSIDVFTM